MSLEPGDVVVYKADPLLFGRMLVLSEPSPAWFECEAVHADPNGEYARGLFGAHELTVAIPAAATA